MSLANVLEKLFAIVVVAIILFWVLAKINKKSFWEYYNGLFDKYFGTTTKINLGGIKQYLGDSVGHKQKAKFVTEKQMTPFEKSRMRKKTTAALQKVGDWINKKGE